MDILLVTRAMRVRMPHCELKWEIPINISDEERRSLLQRLPVIQDFINSTTILV